MTARGPLDAVFVENYFNQHREVKQSILIGKGIYGFREPVVCIQLKTRVGSTKRKQIESELKYMAIQNSMTAVIHTFLFHPSFPLNNGVNRREGSLIDRNQLSHWVAWRLSSSRQWAWIPIGGWILIILGFLFPIENDFLSWFWHAAIFLNLGFHAVQLGIALPLAKKAGIPLWKTVGLTFLFGVTAWSAAYSAYHDARS